MTRLRGFVWLAAGIVLALLAGLVAFATLNRVAQSPTGPGATKPTTTVVAAARDVPVRSVLTLDDLVEIELPADTVPSGAIRTTDEAVGRLTAVPFYASEPLLTQRLIDPNVVSSDGRKALYLVEDEVLMAVPAQDLMSRVGVLRAGDAVDILISLAFPADRGVGANQGTDTEEQATFQLLQNVKIAGLAGKAAPQADAEDAAAQQMVSQPDAVLLTISPQDALALKYAIDAGGTIDLVLRAPGVERPFVTDPVDVDYLINRYRIPTGSGR